MAMNADLRDLLLRVSSLTFVLTHSHKKIARIVLFAAALAAPALANQPFVTGASGYI